MISIVVPPLPPSHHTPDLLQRKINERDHLKVDVDKAQQSVDQLKAKSNADPLKLQQVCTPICYCICICYPHLYLYL